MSNYVGTIYDNEQKVVIVHNGARGARGLAGEEGETGDPGVGINVIGPWANGGIYGPNDAVTARATAAQGVTSLFIQKTDQPISASLIEPYLDLGRWIEVGASHTDTYLGGVWRVVQANHPFSRVGQPAALTPTGYSLASSDSLSTLGIAMVREVVDQDTVILQSTGGIPNVDPNVFQGGAPVTGGTIYYVSTLPGILTVTPPTAIGQYENPIYIPDSPTSGAVLPWRPALNDTVVVGVPSALTKYFYTATSGQTVFSGPDNNGLTLDLTDSQVDVFQNGLNLTDLVQWTNTDTSVTLVSAASAGDSIEIWGSAAQPLAPLTRFKLDTLVFDGVETQYGLTVATNPVPYSTAPAFDIYLDGNPQEAEVDFTMIDVGGDTVIQFAVAPEVETGFWGIAAVPEV